MLVVVVVVVVVVTVSSGQGSSQPVEEIDSYFENKNKYIIWMSARDIGVVNGKRLWKRII